MALIAMAVYSTEENKKDEYLDKTLASICNTVDFSRHRLMLSVNGKTRETEEIIEQYIPIIERVIYNDENIGTARAINKVIRERKDAEHVIKCDDDWVTAYVGWADDMEDTISREPKIGILGLKRNDLIQSTWHPDPEFRSELIMLPHRAGERWLCYEKTSDVIGTSTMFNYLLLNKIGYSYQPGLYGYEDTLFCRRAHLAGFFTGFLNYILIHHIDGGNNLYQTWKEKHSGEYTSEMIRIFKEYVSGKRSIYQEFY